MSSPQHSSLAVHHTASAQLWADSSPTLTPQSSTAPSSALLKVAEFDAFTPDNDPHGEHDFLSFALCNRTFFWKCDYYNSEMDGGSEDPADPAKTTRVGTLMLAEDY